MTLTVRRAIIGSLTFALLFLVTPAASAAASGWERNKAYLEYEERNQLASQPASDWQRNKAYLEYLERQRSAARPPAVEGPLPPGEPVDVGAGPSVGIWQLVITVTAVALVGVIAVTAARRRKVHHATPHERELTPGRT